MNQFLHFLRKGSFMSATKDSVWEAYQIEQKQKEKQRQGPLYKALLPIVEEEINKLDPIGLFKMGCPEDEYKDEIDEIARLSLYEFYPAHFQLLIFSVLAHKFSILEAGGMSQYGDAAKRMFDKKEELRKVKEKALKESLEESLKEALKESIDSKDSD